MKKLGLFFAVALLLGSCKKDKNEVDYLLNCTDCDVTYLDENGTTQTETGVTTGWTYTFIGKKGQKLFLSAKNNQESGTVNIRITVDANLKKQATDSGPKVEVSVETEIK